MLSLAASLLANPRSSKKVMRQEGSDSEVRNVDVTGLMPEAIRQLYPEVRRRYEAKIEAVQALPEVHVLGGLSLRLYRLMLVADAHSQAGLAEEMGATLRSASESILNLIYIMDAGPARPDENKSTTELAKMFIAYGDIGYFKLISDRSQLPEIPSNAGRGGPISKSMNNRNECETKRDEALALGCQKRSWHRLGLAPMATQVLRYLPNYVDPVLAEMVFSSFAVGNSATHGDSLYLRMYYRGRNARPLELVPKQVGCRRTCHRVYGSLGMETPSDLFQRPRLDAEVDQ
ncbi:hypothetical protein U1Q18_052063 [Sarracenia purpurea var. burkii]